ncbi:hypothetical protein Tco_0203938, partial [Tanacetum coccineum]
NLRGLNPPSHRLKSRKALLFQQCSSRISILKFEEVHGVHDDSATQLWKRQRQMQPSRENSGKWKVKTEDVVDVFQAYFVLCARNVRPRRLVDLPQTATAAEFRYEEIPDSEVFHKYTDLCATSVTTTCSVNSSARLQAKGDLFLNIPLLCCYCSVLVFHN